MQMFEPCTQKSTRGVDASSSNVAKAVQTTNDPNWRTLVMTYHCCTLPRDTEPAPILPLMLIVRVQKVYFLHGIKMN